MVKVLGLCFNQKLWWSVAFRTSGNEGGVLSLNRERRTNQSPLRGPTVWHQQLITLQTLNQDVHINHGRKSNDYLRLESAQGELRNSTLRTVNQTLLSGRLQQSCSKTIASILIKSPSFTVSSINERFHFWLNEANYDFPHGNVENSPAENNVCEEEKKKSRMQVSLPDLI